MRDIVVAEAPQDRPVRILDLGCGTGSLAFRLADALPSATIVGLDVSPANIAAAERERAKRQASGRVRFVVADYLAFRTDPFDLIVSDGVLHLIACGTPALVRKLAGDLHSGGVLVCAMPFACLYNTVFSATRRVLRRIRRPWTDAGILAIGRALHGREMDEAGLRERVGYMYLPPVRVMDRDLEQAFAAEALERRSQLTMPSISASQLKHRVFVFSKRA